MCHPIPWHHGAVAPSDRLPASPHEYCPHPAHPCIVAAQVAWPPPGGDLCPSSPRWVEMITSGELLQNHKGTRVAPTRGCAGSRVALPPRTVPSTGFSHSPNEPCRCPKADLCWCQSRWDTLCCPTCWSICLGDTGVPTGAAHAGSICSMFDTETRHTSPSWQRGHRCHGLSQQREPGCASAHCLMLVGLGEHEQSWEHRWPDPLRSAT